MNQLAIVMGNPLIEGAKFGLINAPKRYEKAKTAIVFNAFNISHPHFADTYNILSE